MAEKKISKTTSDQLKFSQTVEHATAQHGEPLAEKVTRMFWGTEAPPISLTLVVRALLVLLQLASRGLRNADAAYMDELADDDPARAERNAAFDALRALFAKLQGTIVSTFGEAYAGKVGLLGPVEERPDMLARRGQKIVRLMRKETPPEPLLEGVTVDVVRLVAQLEAGTDRLAAAITAVGVEKAEADAALVARQRAAQHWERVMRLVANFMVGLAEVAGELGIAARIRPTIRRLRGDLEGDNLDEDLGDDEDGEDLDPASDPLVTDPTDPQT